jgi:hypothetical protein
MQHRHPRFQFLITFVAASLWGMASAQQPFTVTVDYSQAPSCQTFAEKSKTLVEEWYPKLTKILFGDNHPLPYPEVKLIFKPMKGVAGTVNNEITISEEWVTKKAPDDYGMVIHELTHVVQNYKGKGEGWLTEGIADYTRDRHFEPGKRTHRIDRVKNSYKQGYGIAAAFLIWLEDVKTKDKDLVRKLNTACNDGTYSAEKFKERCGADADTLWKEFLATQAK